MLFTKSIPTTEETSDTDFSQKEMGKSDVSGAGVGAIGGSVAGSVGSAVEQVIDRVWP